MTTTAIEAVSADLTTPTPESSKFGPSSRHLPVAFGLAVGLAACGGGGSETPQAEDIPAGVGPSSPEPEPVPTPPPTRVQASRFLAQASMGADKAQIDRVVSLGFVGWLDEQMALPVQGARWDFLRAGGFDAIGFKHNQTEFDAAAWNKLVASPDTLRQRVVLALSEIFVAAIDGMSGSWQQFAACAYLDLLDTQAFGNYRTLLQTISLSPSIGGFLTYWGNAKANLTSRRAARRKLRTRVDAVVHHWSGRA